MNKHLLANWLHTLGLPASWPEMELIEWHQAAAHFPVGLLLTSVLFDILGAMSRKTSLRDAAFWTHLAGTLAAAATFALGWFGNPFKGKHNEIAGQALVHQWWGLVSLILFALLAAWRLARRNNLGRGEKWAFSVLSVLAALLLSVTGYLGGHLLD